MSMKLNPLSGQFDLVFDKASEIQNTPAGNITSANVQAALNELDGFITALPSPIYYAGVYNATTNSPTLANTDVGMEGKLYRVTTAGTQNFGAGNITFAIGDSVVNNGTVWEKWDHSDEVLSVNSQTGAVVLVTDDIAEDGTPANLWFTDSRAQAAITGGASSIVTSNLTSNRALASDGSGKVAVSATTDAELAFVSGVTSAIQTQLNAKQATITGAATSITTADLTASRAVVSDGSGKVAVSATTSAEIGFVSGLTSAVQTQLNAKQPLWQTLAVSSNVALTASRIHLVDTSAARTLTLPAAAADLVLMVKDSTGGAEAFNITINPAAGTIDGVSSLVISSNYGSVYLVSDSVNWFIL